MKNIFRLLLLSGLYFAIPQISYANASCNIGKIFYEKGKYTKAFNYLKKLARYNDACSKYYLGVMYFYGQGTKKNVKLATKYISEAEKLGYADAIAFFDNQE